MRWYRGDCHVHSDRSHGGELTPAQLAAAARTFGLDFIAATEHNTCDTHPDWAAQADAGLLVILGQEVTTETGHWLALGLSDGQGVDGGLCVAAHPHAPYPTGKLEYPHELFDAVEVWNGLWTSDLPWNADNEQALADWARSLADGVHSGQWRPAIGNSDTHLAGQIGIPHTVVRASELSPEAILTALRAGHSWIAASPTINLTLTATVTSPGPGRSAGVGETLRADGEPVLVQVDVEGVPEGEISFYTERGLVHRETLPRNGSGSVRWQSTASVSGGGPERLAAPNPLFVRVEVRLPGGQMAALTNPVILA